MEMVSTDAGLTWERISLPRPDAYTRRDVVALLWSEAA